MMPAREIKRRSRRPDASIKVPIRFPRAAKHVTAAQDTKQCQHNANPFTEDQESTQTAKRQLVKSLYLPDAVPAPVTEPFNSSVC